MFKPVVPALGNYHVTENFFFNDEAVETKMPSAYDMFFKPYDSIEEFLFNLRHTVNGAVMVGGIVSSIGLYIGTGIAVTAFVAEKFYNDYTEETRETSANMRGFAEGAFAQIIQILVDLVTLPLSLLVMITRGISTAIDFFCSLCNEQQANNNDNSNYHGHSSYAASAPGY